MSRHDDGVAWLQLDVLLHVLAFRYVLVVELQRHRATVNRPDDVDLVRLGELAQPAGEGDELQHVARASERKRAGLRDLAGDEHSATVELSYDDGDVGVREEARPRLLKQLPKSLGRQTRRDHVSNQGQR